MKRGFMTAITDLPKPCLKNGKLSSIADPKQCLMPREQFIEYQKKESKNYIWDNYFTDVAENAQEKGEREYRGQRVKKHMKTWEGIGEIKYKDGTHYMGFTKKKRFEGRGRIVHPTGDIYQGDFVAGKAHGKGVLVQPAAGACYDGDWVNDVRSGKGTEVWDNEQYKYVGDFKEGKKTGKGVFTYKDGRYEGDFVDGQYHGEGKLHSLKDKRTCEGTFKNNNFVKGKLLLEDGSYYEGEYRGT